MAEHSAPQHALSRSKTPKKPIRPKGKEIGGVSSDVGPGAQQGAGGGETTKKKGKTKLSLEQISPNDGGYDSSLPLSSRERIRKRKKEEKVKRKRRKDVAAGTEDDECTDVEEQVALRELRGDDEEAMAEEQPTPDHDGDDGDDENADRDCDDSCNAIAREDLAHGAEEEVAEAKKPQDLDTEGETEAQGEESAADVAQSLAQAEMPAVGSSVAESEASRGRQADDGANSDKRSDGSDVGEPIALPVDRDSTGLLVSTPATSIALLGDAFQGEASPDESALRKKVTDPASKLLKKQRKKEKKEKKERKAKRKEKKEKARSMEGGTHFGAHPSAGVVTEKDLASVPSASAIAERPATLKRQVTPPRDPSNAEGWMSPRRKSATHAKRTAARKAKKKSSRSGYDSEPELGSGFSTAFSRGRKRSGSATFDTEMEVPSMIAPKKEGKGGAFRWLKKSSLFSDGGSVSDTEGKSSKRKGKRGFQTEFAKPARSASKDHSKEMKKAKKELMKFKGKKKDGIEDFSPKPSPQASPKGRDPAEDAEMEAPELDDDDDDIAPMPAAPTPAAAVPAVAAAKSATKEGPAMMKKGSGSNIAAVFDDLDKGAPKKKGGMLSRFKNRKVIKAEQRRAATQIQTVWKGYILRKKLVAAGAPLPHASCQFLLSNQVRREQADSPEAGRCFAPARRYRSKLLL